MLSRLFGGCEDKWTLKLAKFGKLAGMGSWSGIFQILYRIRKTRPGRIETAVGIVFEKMLNRILLGTATPMGKIIAVLMTVVLTGMIWDSRMISVAYAA